MISNSRATRPKGRNIEDQDVFRSACRKSRVTGGAVLGVGFEPVEAASRNIGCSSSAVERLVVVEAYTIRSPQAGKRGHRQPEPRAESNSPI